MKKISYFLLVITIGFLFVGCHSSKALNQQLTKDTGSWDLDGYGTSIKCTFYENGTFNWRPTLTSPITNSGEYTMDEKAETLTLNGKEKIFTYTNVTVQKNGSITMLDGEKEITLEKEE